MDIIKYIEKGLGSFDIQCDKDTVKKLCYYIEELDRWNRHINLTGIKDIHSIVEILLYDAFFLFKNIKDRKTILDMGSGNGILSITISILNKSRDFTNIFSVDKRIKKIQFQRHIKRMLHLSNLTTIHKRIEMLEPMGVDTLLAKGFGTTEDILRYGGNHLTKEGLAFILKGSNEIPHVIEGFCLKKDECYALPDGNRMYTLFVYQKS